MTDFILAVVSFLIVLGPLVLIHELGHFIAARLVGITVLEFGIGFPPRALKLFEQGGTKFTLNWLPLGGFVRPLGEDYVKPVGEEATEKEREIYREYQAEMESVGKKVAKPKSVMEATPLQRIFFMVAGALMNFIGAFIILVIAAMIGRPILDSATITIVDTVEGAPAAKAGLQRGDIITQVNGKPVKLSDDATSIIKGSYNKGVDITYKHGDEVKTVHLDTAEGDFAITSDGVMITEIAKGSPAESVFRIGDRVTQVDSTKVTTTDELVRYVTAKAGTEIKVTIIRGSETLIQMITPRKSPPSGQGPLGISIEPPQPIDKAFGFAIGDREPSTTRVEKASFSEAVSMAADQFGGMVNRIVQAPVMLIRGTLSAAEARPVSVVGISQMGAQVTKQSIETGQAYPLLGFAAVISIALGITNLLPIPALDGGRILFVLLEILRGKPIDQEREGYVHYIGLMILLGLSALLIINDLINPIIIPGLK
jgi:regulator of sigma E protease